LVSSAGRGEKSLAADHLSPALASLLFVDLPRGFIGYDAADRAERLERSWESSDSQLAHTFESLPDLPLLLLNGTAVDSGCRFNVAHVDLGATPSDDKPVD